MNNIPTVVFWQRIIGITQDGKFGPDTKKATIEWQNIHGLLADGIVGPKTWIKAGVIPPLETIYQNVGANLETVNIVAVKGIENASLDDLAAMIETARSIGIEPDYLATVIAFETAGKWSPSVKNPRSGATGLIQFLKSTAIKLGTTVDELAQMSFSQQLVYVAKYFSSFGKLNTLEDTYLAVFYPKAIGLSSNAIIASAGESVYEQNKGFDTTNKGYITKSDITSTIRSVYNQGKARGVVEVPLVHI